MLPPAGPASAAALADMAPSSTLLAATLAAAASASAPTSSTTSPSFSATDSDQGDCELLGPFALLVQLALGGLALLALVYKRWRERPQRPVKIWFFDVSKQVFGSVLVHAANVFMSMLTSGSFSINEMEPVTTRLMKRGTETDDGYVPNPCSWYLLNLAIDVSQVQAPLHSKRVPYAEKTKLTLPVDHTRYPDLNHPASRLHWPRFFHTPRQPSRVDPRGVKETRPVKTRSRMIKIGIPSVVYGQC